MSGLARRLLSCPGMSFFSGLLRRWGYAKLSDYGLALAGDRVVPLDDELSSPEWHGQLAEGTLPHQQAPVAALPDGGQALSTPPSSSESPPSDGIPAETPSTLTPQGIERRPPKQRFLDPDSFEERAIVTASALIPTEPSRTSTKP